MENVTETMTARLRNALDADGHLESAAFGTSLQMVRLEGTDFRLGESLPSGRYHLLLQVHKGEVRLTANGERMGFDAPVYVDFIPGIHWRDLTLKGPFRACFVLVEQLFFMEATASMRGKISTGMMHFAQSPFTPLEETEWPRLQRLEESLFATLRETRHLFARELLQTMLCAWQYEWWNIFLHHRQASRLESTEHWNDTAAHFLYLAHTHCRERHGVGWYAQQVGLSSDTLSAVSKRVYGKSASALLMELLVSEAKVCLRNSSLSLQEVAEMLGFSDQSAFGKFFKRQCGVSPAQYKKETEEGRF